VITQKPFTVMGVDLSYTCTGIAIVQRIASPYLWDLKTKPLEDAAPYPGHGLVIYRGTLLDRAVYIGNRLRNEAVKREVDLVAIEGPSYSSRQGQMFHTGMLHGIVQYLLNEEDLRVRLVPPSVWRKVIFGKGTVIDKEKTRLRAYQKFGFGEEFSIDAIEAYCVAHTAWLAFHPYPEPEILKYQGIAINEWLNPRPKKKRTKTREEVA
jgi:Holliday junction resolvasome RuvABC endonuclease subunit